MSTAGLVPQIRKLAQESNAALAVSLHAPDDELRNVLVPINRRHPIAELLEACWDYAEATNAMGITFEYVMLSGVNDSEAQARALAKLLVNRPAKVNLIPFNPFPGSDYRRSTPDALDRFRQVLLDNRIMTMVRRTRGDDIAAACGQLAGQVSNRVRVSLGEKSRNAESAAPRDPVADLMGDPARNPAVRSQRAGARWCWQFPAASPRRRCRQSRRLPARMPRSTTWSWASATSGTTGSRPHARSLRGRSRRSPDLARAHAVLGIVFERLEDPKGAEREYRRAVELDGVRSRTA